MSAAPDEAKPYLGSRPYAREDAAIFFGRHRESHEVASLWRASKLLVVHGEAGIGKTSLTQAGVLPLFQPDFAEILPSGRVTPPAIDTISVGEENPYVLALLSSWVPAKLAVSKALTVARLLAEQTRRTDRYGDPIPIFAIIDQFEELFSDVSERAAHRDNLMEQLAAALAEQPLLHLMINIRDDYLAALLPYTAMLAPERRSQYRLLGLAVEDAVAAVSAALTTTSRRFAPGAAERLVNELRITRGLDEASGSGHMTRDRVRPLELQAVCSALWHSLPEDVIQIRETDIDIHRILIEFTAGNVTEVASEFDLSTEALSDWLNRTFVTELGTKGTAYEGLTSTAGMPNEVARSLEDRRILRAERRSGSRWYELQHDRLIDALRYANRLRPWLEFKSGSHSAAYLRAAESALADGELDLAEKHAAEALRTAGADEVRIRAETETFLGNLALQRSRPDRAEEHYGRAAELFELLLDRTAVGRLLAATGRLLLDRGEYAAAVRAWQGAAERLSGDLTVQVDHARALVAAGQLRAAAGVFNAVLEVAADFPEALAGRGEVLADLGDPVPAVADLSRLLVLQPDRGRRADVRSARGVALAQLGRFADADVELAAALREAPEHGPVLLRAARAAAHERDRARAAELAERALAAAAPALFPYQRSEAARLSRSG